MAASFLNTVDGGRGFIRLAASKETVGMVLEDNTGANSEKKDDQYKLFFCLRVCVSFFFFFFTCKIACNGSLDQSFHPCLHTCVGIGIKVKCAFTFVLCLETKLASVDPFIRHNSITT